MASLKSSKSWSRSWLRKVLSGSWLSTCSPERQELRNGHILFSKYILNYHTSGYFLVKELSAWLNRDKFRIFPPAAWPCRQVGRRGSLSPSTSTTTCFTTSCFNNFPCFTSIFLFALTLSFRVLILWFRAARPTDSITNTVRVHADHYTKFYCQGMSGEYKYFSIFWSHLLDERAGPVECRLLNFSLTNADILLASK